MKKSIKNLILSILILVILGGGYFFAAKWQPKTEEEDLSENALPSYELLVDIDIEDVHSVTFNTGITEYTLVNGDPVVMQGYSSSLIPSDKLIIALKGALYITGSHKVENVGDNLSDYGLDKRERYVTINLKDGSKKTLLIGNKANYDDNYFAMIEGTDAVYVVASYKLDSLMEEPSTLRDREICTINSEAIKELSVSRGGSPVITLTRSDEKTSEENSESAFAITTYKITYPYSNLTASIDKLSPLLEKFTSLSAYDFTEENPTDLSVYGLSDPTVLTITEDKVTHKIKLGKKFDDNKVYIMYNDVDVVYTIRCDFYDDIVNLDPSEYIDRYIHLFNLSTVSSVELNIDGEKFVMEADKNSAKDKKYRINGKAVSDSVFKNIYQAIIGVKFSSLADTTPSGKEKASITFNFKDKTSKTFTYYTYDDRRCIVESDFGITCLTLTKNIDAISDVISSI